MLQVCLVLPGLLLKQTLLPIILLAPTLAVEYDSTVCVNVDWQTLHSSLAKTADKSAKDKSILFEFFNYLK